MVSLGICDEAKRGAFGTDVSLEPRREGQSRRGRLRAATCLTRACSGRSSFGLRSPLMRCPLWRRGNVSSRQSWRASRREASRVQGEPHGPRAANCEEGRGASMAKTLVSFGSPWRASHLAG